MYNSQEREKIVKHETQRNLMYAKIDEFRRQIISSAPVEGSPLSHRETEILREVATGKHGKQIAKELYLDIETVKSHLKSIYRKLHVHLRADAIKVAVEKRFI